MTKIENPGELLDAVIKLAEEAGQQILKIYERDFSVTEKEDRTPLTEADTAAHNTIVAGLTELTPQLPILSEESAEIQIGRASCRERV